MQSERMACVEYAVGYGTVGNEQLVHGIVHGDKRIFRIIVGRKTSQWTVSIEDLRGVYKLPSKFVGARWSITLTPIWHL
jgi:hypothetical protein